MRCHREIRAHLIASLSLRVRARRPAALIVGRTIHGGERQVVDRHAREQVAEGRQTFRFDTFGDEDFWGGVLGPPGVSPATALAVGLKVDVDALPGRELARSPSKPRHTRAVR